MTWVKIYLMKIGNSDLCAYMAEVISTRECLMISQILQNVALMIVYAVIYCLLFCTHYISFLS